MDPVEDVAETKLVVEWRDRTKDSESRVGTSNETEYITASFGNGDKGVVSVLASDETGLDSKTRVGTKKEAEGKPVSFGTGEEGALVESDIVERGLVDRKDLVQEVVKEES